MTRDEIQNAAPEQLRVWVAEKVMGWTHVSTRTWYGYPETGPIGDNEPVPPKWPGRPGASRVPDYPVSWDAAGQVVEKMREKGCVMVLSYHFIDRREVATVIWKCLFHDGADLFSGYVRACAAPEAICKAVLLAALGAAK